MAAVKNLLHMADDGQQGKDGFNDYTFIPGVLLTQFEIVRDTICKAKADVREGDGLSIEFLNLIIELLIVRVHRQPFPGDHLLLVIDDPAQFDAYRPASLVFVLATELLLAPAFPNGEDEFNRKAICHGEKGWVCQQRVTPFTMRFQQSQQTRPVWQTRKQSGVVTFQPAIEGSKMPPFERKQNPYRHQLAGIQFGLRVLLYLWQLIIDKTKDVNDNVFCGHDSGFLFGLDNLKIA